MNKFMKQAIIEAQKGIANNEGGPFGCVIVKDGKIIARGHNQVVKNNDATCHGEIQAIRKASKKLCSFDLSGCELYTTEEPCNMCLSACIWANIDKIYYGCTIKDNSKIGFRDENIDDIFGGREKLSDYLICINRQECLNLFDEYLNIKNKTSY